MLIPKAAVRRYLERSRRDCREYLRLTEGQLLSRRKALPTRPPIWKRLRRHQRAGLIAIAELLRVAVHSDTGTGKTMLAIAAGRYFQAMGKAKRWLIIVPNKPNKFEWAREVAKHSPRAGCLVLKGTTEQKWAALAATEALFIVETVGGLVRMVSALKPLKKKRKVVMRRGKVVMKLRPVVSRVRKLVAAVDGLVIDESTEVKNKKTLPFRICRQISLRAHVVLGMSGTPFGDDPEDLWSQLYLIDLGETLGETLGLFRAAFFSEKENGWGGYEYTFRTSKKAELHRVLANRVLRYRAKDIDLPRATEIIKYVTLPRAARGIYDRARDALIAARGDWQESKNLFLRMRQISSGFVGFRDVETRERQLTVLDAQPKLDLMLATIETIPHEYKIVIFHEYTYSGNKIAAALDDMNIGYARLYGGTKDAGAELARFDKDPNCRVQIINNKAGSMGLNLQVARYVMYYEAPVSVIKRKQSRARVVRQESKHDRVFIYDFVVKGTVDQQILDSYKSSEDLFRAIVNGKVDPL